MIRPILFSTVLGLSAWSVAEAQYIDQRATTPIQGILYGEADVIRAEGTYNKLTAEAASIGQDAYSKALDNDLKRVETYYRKKEIHAYAMEKLRKPPLSSEQHAKINSERRGKRLLPSDIGNAGELQWPGLLTAESFAIERQQLQSLFAERALGSTGLGSANQQRIAVVAQGLKKKLQAQVKKHQPGAYMQASTFLDRLMNEARLAVVPERNSGLAAR